MCVGSLTRTRRFVDRVRRRPPTHGLADRVRLVGPRTGAELDAAYAAADLLVLASRGETYGMVVTEALARGIPVLARRWAGCPRRSGARRAGRRPAGAAGRPGRRWPARCGAGSPTPTCATGCGGPPPTAARR